MPSINVPDDILVRKVDLAVELQILSFYQERRGTGTDFVSATP